MNANLSIYPDIQDIISTGSTMKPYQWVGPSESICYEDRQIEKCLLNLNGPLYVIQKNQKTGITQQGNILPADPNNSDQAELMAFSPPLRPENLGDPAFRNCYGVDYACLAGAMAHGIASEEMVISLARAGFMASFGAAGLSPKQLDASIERIQSALPQLPFAVNLIHNPNFPSTEQHTVDILLKRRVPVVEASAFLDLTPAIVHYRAAGLEEKSDGQIVIQNHIIAKLSRTEVAEKFMQPAPLKILDELLAKNLINSRQHRLAQNMPMADDITVEADSGGHTDNRPLVCLLPTMLALRDEIHQQYQYRQPIRVGAGGGISTPAAALAAFMMGAAYIVTGSVNQACLEAGTCDHTRRLLAQAGMADVTMAPSADMFEMGVKVQVLKKGTLYPMRAQKLYEIYSKYPAIDSIPEAERQKIEKFFQHSIEEVWQETRAFFLERDPGQIQQAESNAKKKMALIFRWYLGQSSRWANQGVTGREMDYQIWCGPSMGTFNDWVRGTYLEQVENRRVADVNRQILSGCAYQYQIQNLVLQGVHLPQNLALYIPFRTKNQSAVSN